MLSALPSKGSRSRSTASERAEQPAAAVTISDSVLEKLTDVFKMLADGSRLKIILALARAGEMHVTGLCELLKQSQPAVSHHLTLMRMVGLVNYRRDGKNNYYFLVSEHLRELLERFFVETGDGSKALQLNDFSLVFKPTK